MRLYRHTRTSANGGGSRVYGLVSSANNLSEQGYVYTAYCGLKQTSSFNPNSRQL